MDNSEILSHVDLTLLKADATEADILALCSEAMEAGCASICINSIHVNTAVNYLDQLESKLPVATVIGFPLGAETLQHKWHGIREAIREGASELDVVINLADVKAGNWDAVRHELGGLREAAGNVILKIIIETCYLTDEEKVKLCELISETGCDYIKTSTGFGSAGAELSDIALFKKHLSPGIKIKAAGGIRTREQMEAFLDAGCDRLGSSQAVHILT